MKTTTAVISLALLSPLAASGQVVDTFVDPSQSSIALDVELQTSFGNRTDSDSSPVTGTAQVELDLSGDPNTITLRGFRFEATESLAWSFDYGVFGAVNASATGLALTSTDPVSAVTADLVPVGPDQAADFSLLAVPTLLEGVVNVSGTGIVGGLIGSMNIDLAAQPASTIDVTGSLAIEDDELTLFVDAVVNTSTMPADGVTAVFAGTASLTAIGTIPSVCLPDVNGDGIVSPADFNAWIIAFNSNAPECDQNGDGLCTPADFNAWILNFNAGC